MLQISKNDMVLTTPLAFSFAWHLRNTCFGSVTSFIPLAPVSLSFRWIMSSLCRVCLTTITRQLNSNLMIRSGFFIWEKAKSKCLVHGENPEGSLIYWPDRRPQSRGCLLYYTKKLCHHGHLRIYCRPDAGCLLATQFQPLAVPINEVPDNKLW